jgi:hypothetical protein
MESTATTKCPQCGKEIPEGLDRCPHCGADPTAKKKTSPALLVVLLFVLAGLGAFYLFGRKTDVEVYWKSKTEAMAEGAVLNKTDKPIKNVFIIASYLGEAAEGGQVTLETFPFPVIDATKPAPRGRPQEGEIPGVRGRETIEPGKEGTFSVPINASKVQGFRVYTKEGATETDLSVRYVDKPSQ